ncbi:LLM class F420-dependent oxidoreductase, partial [Actinomadura adrarensis]
RYCEVPLAYGKDEASAAASAHRQNRFGLLGWKVMAELPNPINFEAATASITEDDIRQNFGCGPDPARHMEVARQFMDAGFDHLALLNAGPDVDGFFEYYATELKGRFVDSR